jgi:adenine phosphoribosyltransferase
VPVSSPCASRASCPTTLESYNLEYGTDSLEVHVDAADTPDRVLLVDDVIATGGTAAAAIKLLHDLGAEVVGLSVFIELTFLHGRERLGDLPLHALLEY